MKTTIVSLLSCAVLFTVASCSKNDSSTPSTNAQVMFVNGCAAVDIVDASVGGVKVTNAANVMYNKNSGYQNVVAGSGLNIAFLLTSTQANLASQAENLTANTHYSVFLAGLSNVPSMVFTTDDLTSPGADSVKVRFINLSADTGSITASATSAVIASGIAYKGVSAFKTIASGSYHILADNPNDVGGSLVDDGTQTLAGGKIYTIILTGTITATTTYARALTIINNN